MKEIKVGKIDSMFVMSRGHYHELACPIFVDFLWGYNVFFSATFYNDKVYCKIYKRLACRENEYLYSMDSENVGGIDAKTIRDNGFFVPTALQLIAQCLVIIAPNDRNVMDDAIDYFVTIDGRKDFDVAMCKEIKIISDGKLRSQ